MANLKGLSDQTVRRIAAGAALAAGLAWGTDYIALPMVWEFAGHPPEWGSAFQSLDGLCLAIEFAALAGVAIAMHLQTRPTRALGWVALVLATLGAAVGVPAGLWATASGTFAGSGFEVAAIALSAAWLIVTGLNSLVRLTLRRWAAWACIGMGTIWLVGLVENAVSGTNISGGIATLMFPLWASLFAVAQLVGGRPAVSSVPHQVPQSAVLDTTGRWVSSDGRWWWDGTAWRSVANASRSGPATS